MSICPAGAPQRSLGLLPLVRLDGMLVALGRLPRLLLPKAAWPRWTSRKCKSHATVTASLGGAGQDFQCSGKLELVGGCKKQWLQLGYDPHGLRVQLHLFAAPDGSGYHIIHARVTPP